MARRTLVDLRCEDRTVQWIGLEYTFINFASEEGGMMEIGR